MNSGSDQYGDEAKQIIWPWTWYHTLAVVLEDDLSRGKLIVASLIFWLNFDKIGVHPLDHEITQSQLEEMTD